MADSDLVLALDVGTTNVKAAVVDRAGNLLKIARQPMTVEQDETGRAEHDPDTLFDTVVNCCKEAADGYQGRITLLVSATYQMGLIALDAADAPLTGMMTLLDTRARATHSDLLQAISGETLYNKTGCPPLFHYPLAKLFWLKAKRPEIFKNAQRVLSCKDYLLRRLTGLDLADVSVSSTTQYMNIQSLTWDKEILDAVGIPAEMLPQAAPTEQIVTDNLDNIRPLLGLPTLNGILLGTYDGGAVGIGLGVMQEDTAVMNFGTSAMLRFKTDNPALSNDGTMRIQSSCLIKDVWIPGGAVNNAGGVLNWLSSVFDVKYPQLLAEAKGAADLDGLIFLPYLSGERTLEVGANASGSFYGLRGHHTRGHMIRAALEGVAFSLRRVQDAVNANGFQPAAIHAGAGGSHSALWMEIVASVLNTSIRTTHASEPGLLGSGMLGHCSLGAYPDLGAATLSMVRPDRTYHPDARETKKYTDRYSLFNLLTQQMKEADDRIGLSLL